MAKYGPLFHIVFSVVAWLPLGAASAGTWQPVGVGDCPGRDVSGSNGPRPDGSKCDASFAGNTAVCWTNGCTYKSVATAACTGGANPGQMYTCVASAAPPAAPPPSTGTWQYTGVGDCPGRDVAGSAGAKPDGSKCNASFAGNTAVCWASGCTYKSVATAACTGGANPGQMYTCMVAGAAPAAPPAAAAAIGWQPMGVGDCPGRDVGGSRGPLPEAAKCDANFAGFTAVCWANGCTYKNVLTGQCIGGANPGQMYTCGAPGAGGGMLPPPPATPKLTGKKYSVVNYTGDKQSPHDFMVDWKACKVAELGQDPDKGPADVTVEVCRPGSRLIIKTDFKKTNYFIHYDWVLLDNGATLAGAYCDQTTCGPSAGKRK